MAIYYNYVAQLDNAKNNYYNRFFNLTSNVTFNWTDPERISFYENTVGSLPIVSINVTRNKFKNFNFLKNYTQDYISEGRTVQKQV